VIQILNSLDRQKSMMVLDNTHEKSPKQYKCNASGCNSSKAPQSKSIYHNPEFQQPYVIVVGVSDETDTLKLYWRTRVSTVLSAYKKTKNKIILYFSILLHCIVQ
jgi:3-methyladenine DNA glycosylase AlkC